MTGNGTNTKQIKPTKLFAYAIPRLWKMSFGIIGNAAAIMLLINVLIAMVPLVFTRYTSMMYTTPLMHISTTSIPVKTPERACQIASVEGSEVQANQKRSAGKSRPPRIIGGRRSFGLSLPVRTSRLVYHVALKTREKHARSTLPRRTKEWQRCFLWRPVALKFEGDRVCF
jgi:hypothetical protein